MKQISRLFIPLFLTAVMLCAPLVSYAAGVDDNASSELEEVMSKIKLQYPNAVVEVNNGVISVYVPECDEDEARNPDNNQVRASENSVYAPNGGTWTGFSPPGHYYLTTPVELPVQYVYLTATQVDALVLAFSDEDAFDEIMENGYNELLTLQGVIEDQYDLSFSLAQLTFLTTYVAKSAYDSLNANSISRAANASSTGKIKIAYTTLDGWPTRYYYSWESNYASDAPWSDCSPTFRAGYFNIV